MSRKNTSVSLFLIIFTFATIFLSTLVISINNNHDFEAINERESVLIDFQDSYALKSSANGNPSLDYSSLYQNVTTVYRLFESIQFDINASKFASPNYTVMQIHYSNNEVEDFNMDYVSGTNFTYIYTPRYYDPLGFQNVSFSIYNFFDSLLSSTDPITNFTITTNYLLLLNSTEYSRGETLYAELIVNDEPQPYDFNWNVTIVDSDNETLQNNLFDVGNNLMQFSFELDDKFNYTNDLYYVKINITDSSRNTKAAAYYPFKVLNTLPEIIVPSISFSKYPS